MSEEGVTRREILRRGGGAIAAAGAATLGGLLLYDPRGGAGLPKPSAARVGLDNYFAHVDFPSGSPRISVAIGADSQIGQMVQTALRGLDPSQGMRRFVRVKSRR